METHDIRWIQRFNNYCKALDQLKSGVMLSKERSLSDLEIQGLIQGFEYTHELAWNTLKDLLEDRGNPEKILGSRDATRLAFKYELIVDGDTWMDMIRSRNLSSHTYNEEVANDIYNKIVNFYYSAFIELQNLLGTEKTKEVNNL